MVAAGEPVEVITERPAFQGHLARVHRADLGQQVRAAPAVQEKVVEGPHDAYPVGADADERDPHQRRGGEVQAAPTVLGEQLPERVGLLVRVEVGPVLS